jgi:BMFP domain-containing protein YqiC
LFKTALRAVHELESLERRVAALEGKAPKGDLAAPATETHQRASLSQRGAV